MSIGGGFSRQKSRQQSESGLTSATRERAAEQIFGLQPQIQEVIGNILSGPSQLNLTPQGLTQGAASQANQLVTAAADSLFNRLSGSGALRGQLSPQNTSSIIGSAAQRAAQAVLPQTLSQAQSNERFNITQPLEQQSQASQLFTQLGGLLSALTQGSTGQSSGSGLGVNFSFSKPTR